MKKKKNDLGIKIATKEEAFWIEIRDKVKTELEAVEKQLKFHKAVLDLAKERIEKSKDL